MEYQPQPFIRIGSVRSFMYGIDPCSFQQGLKAPAG